ncbi:hypothetical protein sos41_18660 [Alphaproteobacteria bacterium SO-S41]|nr:hypothetical protein sos41_18660 [Alphaproteobacteria bacterium SO-S41]
MARVIGTIESLWRYPVKSMRGEECPAVYAGFAGVYGDRLYAVRNAAAPKVFPYLTGRNKPEILLYAPRFRDAAQAAAPPLVAELEKLGIGVTPIYPESEALAVEVVTPSGAIMAIDDPALVAELGEGLSGAPVLSLIRSDRALTDCRPMSLISLQTVAALAGEMGMALDKLRFRANLYADLSGGGFAEDALVGRQVKIGDRAVIAITERDGRCAMIGIDPDTAERDAAIPRHVVQAHEGKAGVYGAVLTEGVVRAGDEILLLD